MNTRKTQREAPAFRQAGRFAAIALPFLLGQGLIYQCVTGRLEVAAAIALSLSVLFLSVAVSSMLRRAEQARLVELHRPPWMALRRNRSESGVGRP